MATVGNLDIRGWTRQLSSPFYDGSSPLILRTDPWPNATTTGVPSGTTLTPSGGFTTTSDGQIIDSLEITGTITVNRNNVIIRNCKINGNLGFYGITYTSGTNLEVTDCEIYNVSSTCLNLAGVSAGSATATRVNCHDSQGDNVKMKSNQTLVDSYLHTPTPTETSHNDGIQISEGSNITITGNRIDGTFQNQTSAIIIKPDFGVVDTVLISNNRLSGGSYTLYIVDATSYPTPTNVTVTNNTWEVNSWLYGPLAFDLPTTTHVWSGNVYTDETPYPSPF